MFIKFGEEAIISIADIVSVRKMRGNEVLRINLKNTEDTIIDIKGDGRTITDRKADVNRMYNFVWESLCDYREKQPDFDGIKQYSL